MNHANNILKKSLIMVTILLCLPIIVWAFVSVRKTISEDASSSVVSEDEIYRYEKGKPAFGEWTRASSDCALPRYRKTGNGFFEQIKPTTSNTARIMCAGDMMCEPVMSKAVFKNNKFFFEACFDKAKKVFEASDFAIANLETSVDQDSPYAIDKHVLTDRYHCNAPLEYLDAVRWGGIDAVTMANNHTCDTGVSGLLHTIQNVEGRDLIHTGAFTSPQDKHYFIVDINGIKVAFFSYTQHINSRLDEKCFTPEGRQVMLSLYSKERLESDLKAARADGAEFTIVYIHFWCKDYTHEVQDSQKACAREIAEAGIDCIVGGHPHAVQPYDEIVTSAGKRVPICYCLGNFITSDVNKTTRTNYIYELFLEKDSSGLVRITQEKVIPCSVVEFPEKSGYVVFPTPKNWRDGQENAALQKAEDYIKEYLGDKIEIDYNE